MNSRRFEPHRELSHSSAEQRSPSHESQQISDSEWEKHKSFITELQINSTTTTRMLELLQEYRNFTPSEAQLQARLAKWQLRVHRNTNPVRNVTASTISHSIRAPRAQSMSEDFNTQPSDDGMSNHNAFNEAEVRSEVSDPSVAGTGPRYASSRWSAPHRSSADNYGRYSANNYDNTNTLQGTTFSQSSTLLTNSPLMRSLTTCNVCNSYPIADKSDSTSSLLYQMKIVTSSVPSSSSFPTCDIFTDAGELLYACGMFPEAQCFFGEAYSQLKRDANVSYVQLAFAGINCLRAASRPVCCSPFSDTFVPVGASFVMAQVSKKDRPDDGGNRRSLYYIKLSQLLKDSGVYITRQSEGVRAECQRLRPSNRDAVTREAFQNCYTLSWRRIGLKDQSYSRQVVDTLTEWISDIEDESCHIWRLLRNCLDLLENYCKGPANLTNRDDNVDQRSLSVNPDILGCFLVRDYFRGILSRRLDSQGPLSTNEQLSKFIRYKLDVQTHLLIASWIINSADPMFGGTGQYAPFMLLKSGIQTILSTRISERASCFLQLHEEAWYTPIYERKRNSVSPATENFITQTAVLMAEASVHLARITQHACTDLFTAKRQQRPHSSSVPSQPSNLPKPSFNFTEKLRKKLKGKNTNQNITDELSNNLRSMSLDPGVRPNKHNMSLSPSLSSPSSHGSPSHRMTWSHNVSPISPGYSPTSPASFHHPHHQHQQPPQQHNHPPHQYQHQYNHQYQQNHSHHHEPQHQQYMYSPSRTTHLQAPSHPGVPELEAPISMSPSSPPRHSFQPQSPLRTWHGVG